MEKENKTEEYYNLKFKEINEKLNEHDKKIKLIFKWIENKKRFQKLCINNHKPESLRNGYIKMNTNNNKILEEWKNL